MQHLCHDFGESSLPAYYRPMREFVQAETLFEEDPQRVKRYFAEARSVAQELGVKLRLPRIRPRLHPPGTPGPTRCSWPWKGAYISYQGYAMPCCMVSTPDRINFGNMAEQGVEATWNSASGIDISMWSISLDSLRPTLPASSRVLAHEPILHLIAPPAAGARKGSGSLRILSDPRVDDLRSALD